MTVIKLVVTGVSFAAFVFAADPWAGTWKMKPDPDRNTASRTITEAETGPDTFHVTFDDVSKAGKKSHIEETLVCDGKEHPASGAGEMMICTRTSPTTRTLAGKKDGKIVDQVTHTLSANGRVLTVTNKTTGHIVTYDKQ